MIPDDFTVFILSHGRPGRIDTIRSLEKCGYTGSYYIVIDDEDDTADEYIRRYGDRVIVFNKREVAATFDEGDNFGDRRAVIYARNACFNIAERLGVRYFLELDDDYTNFAYELEKTKRTAKIRNLDGVIEAMLKFYMSISAMSIAFAQTGDYVGGDMDSSTSASKLHWRKCMNSFFCSVDRRYRFVGRINEDVNTYTWYQSLGNVFLTIPYIVIQQRRTQKNRGGMTDLYLDSGTYVKSFYTVMYQPSSVRVVMMTSKHKRFHHMIDWRCTVPYIIRERYRKSAVI